MNEQQDQIVKLLLKKVNNEQLNSDEQEILDSWIARSPHNKTVYDEVTNAPLLEKEVRSAIAGYDRKLLWKQIHRGIHGDTRKGRLIYFFRTTTGRVAAAVVLLLLCTGAYFIFNNSASSAKLASEKIVAPAPADLAPGKEGAVLELADGTSIALDNARNGLLTKQNNVDVIKKDGQIIYNNDSQTAVSASLASYNTLTTRKQQHYRTTLNDGSVVWLNSASSIKFPTTFNGTSERRVLLLSGEAMFEVAKDAKKPFRVEVNGMQVEAVGTAFNINSYADENIKKITLTEGLVKVSKNDKVSFLKPGQQAQLTENGELTVVNNVDIDKITSWKGNSFYFQDDDIKTIMRQIARWYDVDIEYEGRVTNTYTAMVSRDVPVSDIFHSLELSGGVHFVLTTKGSRNVIIVKP